MPETTARPPVRRPGGLTEMPRPTSFAARLEPGDKVKFSTETRSYTVQAVTSNGRYAICTKPFAARRTVLYTIVDFDEQVRGADNLILGNGYDDEGSIERNCDLLERGEMGVSRRNRVPLDIESIKRRPTTLTTT